MKKCFALLMMICLLVPAAFALGERSTIAQSSCSIVQSGDDYLAYCFAKVQNHTDQVLCLDEGVFELTCGEETIASQEISQLWPYFVAPGETGYLFDIVPFEQMPQVTGLEYHMSYLEINPAYAGLPLAAAAHVEVDDGSGLMSVVCVVENDASVDAYDPTIVVGLYTDAGQLIYCDGRNLKDVGIPMGGKLLVRFAVEPTLVEQWAGYGALPTQVQAGAMFRTGTD